MNRFHRWYCRTGHWRHAIQDQILPWVLHDVDLGDDVLEIGPGPGLTTDVLASLVAKLTAVEIDPDLAARLQDRFAGTNVTVQHGDATAMPFADRTFTGAVSFTMLHHVPSPELQDRLLREVRRALRPGATFAGSDSRSSQVFRLAHLADTMVLVDPDTFAGRLEAAGFHEIEVKANKGSFRFRSTVPTTARSATTGRPRRSPATPTSSAGSPPPPWPTTSCRTDPTASASPRDRGQPGDHPPGNLRPDRKMVVS